MGAGQFSPGNKFTLWLSSLVSRPNSNSQRSFFVPRPAVVAFANAFKMTVGFCLWRSAPALPVPSRQASSPFLSPDVTETSIRAYPRRLSSGFLRFGSSTDASYRDMCTLPEICRLNPLVESHLTRRALNTGAPSAPYNTGVRGYKLAELEAPAPMHQLAGHRTIARQSSR